MLNAWLFVAAGRAGGAFPSCVLAFSHGGTGALRDPRLLSGAGMCALGTGWTLGLFYL